MGEIERVYRRIQDVPQETRENKGMVVMMLDPKILKKDEYQRGLAPSLSCKIFREFNPHHLGVIEVSYRNGVFWIVDGQHRVDACLKRDMKEIKANVHFGLTRKEEALMFGGLNTRRSKLRTEDRWRALYEAGNEMVVETKNILESYDFHLGIGKMGAFPKYRTVDAIGTLEKIYKRYDKAILHKIFRILKQLWVEMENQLSGKIGQGLAYFFNHYPDVSEEDFIHTMNRYTPNMILGKAKEIGQFGGEKDKNHAIAILYFYNKDKKKPLENRFDMTK